MSELLSQLKSELEETRRAALERAAGTQDEALVRAMLAHVMNPAVSDSERQFAAECLAKCCLLYTSDAADE